MSWFRVHTTLIHNPKAQALPGNLFKAWMNLLCLAKEGDGIVPGVPEIAFHLRLKILQAEQVVAELEERGFLIRNDDGTFQPNDWNEHQYKSDVSTERVKAFRERSMKQSRNVSRNGSETPSETDTETDTESEKEQKKKASPKSGSADAKGARFTLTELPDEWRAFAMGELGWDLKRVSEEFQQFGDYWREVPGLKGRKLDWIGTWRNRCREVDKRQIRAPTLFQNQPDRNQTRRSETIAMTTMLRGLKP